VQRIEVNMRRYTEGELITEHEQFVSKAGPDDLSYQIKGDRAFVAASSAVPGTRVALFLGPDTNLDQAAEVVIDRAYPNRSDIEGDHEQLGVVIGWKNAGVAPEVAQCVLGPSSTIQQYLGEPIYDETIGERNHIRVLVGSGTISIVEYREKPDETATVETLWSMALGTQRRIALRAALVDGEVCLWWNPSGIREFEDKPLARVHSMIEGRGRMGLISGRDGSFLEAAFEYRTGTLSQPVSIGDVTEASLELTPVRLTLTADLSRPPVLTTLQVSHAEDTMLPERQERTSRVFLRDGRFLVRPGHSYVADAIVRTVDDQVLRIQSRIFEVAGTAEDLSLRDCFGRAVTPGQGRRPGETPTEPPGGTTTPGGTGGNPNPGGCFDTFISEIITALEDVCVLENCTGINLDCDLCPHHAVSYCEDLNQCAEPTGLCPVTAGPGGEPLCGCAAVYTHCRPDPLPGNWPSGCGHYPFAIDSYCIYQGGSYELVSDSQCNGSEAGSGDFIYFDELGSGEVAGSEIEILTWPAALKADFPLRTSASPAAAPIADTMDVVMRGIQRSSLAPRVFEFSLTLDDDTKETLLDFLREAQGRVKPFIWTHPMTGEYVICRFAEPRLLVNGLEADIYRVKVAIVEEPRCLDELIVSPESDGYSTVGGTDPMILGACCIDGECEEITAQECANRGGAYHGDYSRCDDVDCTEPPSFDCINDCGDEKCDSPAGMDCEVFGCPSTHNGSPLCGCFIRDAFQCRGACNTEGACVGSFSQLHSEYWCCYEDGEVLIDKTYTGSAEGYCCTQGFGCQIDCDGTVNCCGAQQGGIE
jgi:hypothetical protein